MRKMIKGQKGLSLVEVTIMLLVLMLLTSVLAPSIWDFVHDAQWVKVKEDCEAISLSISRLVRDVGPCLHNSNAGMGSAAGCTTTNRVDVLKSEFGADAAGGSVGVDYDNIATHDWNMAANGNLDTLEDQLVTNAAGYSTPLTVYGGSYPVGPQFNLGWRGAYLAPPVGPDPWGTKYYVNSGFLVAVGTDNGNEGHHGMWWDSDVVCLSAGPDATIQTSFKLYTGTERQGDDFVSIISGSGR